MISKLTTAALLIVLCASLHVTHKQAITPSQTLAQTTKQLDYLQGLVQANSDYSKKITDNQAFI